MNAIAAAVELAGLAIYRLLPSSLRRYMEYDSMLGHVTVLTLGVAALVGFGVLLAASLRHDGLLVQSQFLTQLREGAPALMQFELLSWQQPSRHRRD